MAEFLGELCGTPFPDEDRVQLRAARRDPILLGDQMRRGLGGLPPRRVRPPARVVLVLEDLHRGDLPTRSRFVDAALRHLGDSRPFLGAGAGAARPEVHQVFLDLWEQIAASRRSTSAPPTRRGSSEELVRSALGASASRTRWSIRGLVWSGPTATRSTSRS